MVPYYYRILEVTPDACHEEIRKAYRRLAKQYHPDLNKSPGAKEHFLLLQKAWQTLGNPEAKASYDFYSKRYVHRSGGMEPPQRKTPPPDPSMKARAYTGYGGRIYYRTVNEETFRKEEKIRRRDWVLVGSVMLLILLIPLFGKLWERGRLRFFGTDTVAEVISFDVSVTLLLHGNGNNAVTEVFPDIFPAAGEWVIPKGMPLKAGDRFHGRYLPSSPYINRISFDEPDQETLDRYCSIIYLRWVSTPFLDSLAAGSMKAVFLFSLCDSLYEHLGTRGLANLYFAGVEPEVNRFSNRKTFDRMAATSDWKRIVRNCREATRPVTFE